MPLNWMKTHKYNVKYVASNGVCTRAAIFVNAANRHWNEFGLKKNHQQTLGNNTSASLDFHPKQENAHTNAITLTRMHRNLPEPEPEKSSVCRRIQFQRKQQQQQQISNRTKGETDYGQKGERMLSISALKWPAYAECASTQMEHVSNVHSTAHTRKKVNHLSFGVFFCLFVVCDAKNRPVRFFIAFFFCFFVCFGKRVFIILYNAAG